MILIKFNLFVTFTYYFNFSFFFFILNKFLLFVVCCVMCKTIAVKWLLIGWFLEYQFYVTPNGYGFQLFWRLFEPDGCCWCWANSFNNTWRWNSANVRLSKLGTLFLDDAIWEEKSILMLWLVLSISFFFGIC